MHASDVNTYEGPPCDQCVRTQFVGTCTHRPRKIPKISEEVAAALTPEVIEEALRKGRKGAEELDKQLDQVFQPPTRDRLTARDHERTAPMNDFPDQLLKAGQVLHWLGKYNEANAMILLSRIARVKKFNEIGEIEAWVTGIEAAALPVQAVQPA